MSECEKYQELISALLDSELSGAESAALAEHLKVCPDCAAMHQAFSALSTTLSESLEAPPAALHENIMAGVRRESVKHANLHRISKPVKNILALAACSAIVIGSVFGLAPMFRASSAAPAQYDAAAGGAARPEARAYSDEAAPADIPAAPEAAAEDPAIDEAPADEGGSLAAAAPSENMVSPGQAGLSGEDWEYLQGCLSGEACSLCAAELRDKLLYTLNVDKDGIAYVYLLEETLYYSAPGSEAILRSGLSEGEFLSLLEGFDKMGQKN